MTDEEKIALKAACMQHATALNGAAHPRVPIDAEECAKLAKERYERVTGTRWVCYEQRAGVGRSAGSHLDLGPDGRLAASAEKRARPREEGRAL